MPNWRSEERRACEQLDARHRGGSGHPDCVGDDFVAEVKSYSHRPVDRGILQRTLKKTWATDVPLKFVSRTGYTDGARVLAEIEGVELYVQEGGRVYPLSGLDVQEPEDSALETAAKVVVAVGAGVLIVGGIAALIEAMSPKQKR